MGAGPSWWTGAVGAAIQLYLRRRISRLSDARHWAENSRRIQTGVLRGLLRAAAGTEVGRARGFAGHVERSDADMLRAYRESQPPGDYEAWRPLMARMREGAEPGVTWPGVVMDWAQTSGTTGGQKYIPVSREMMRANFRAALDIFAHAARFGVPLSSLFAGRLLFLGGSTSLEVNRHGVRTGDLSGLVTPMIRWPLSRVYSPGPGIALMDHWPSKIEAMARAVLDQNIRMVSGMASWSLVLFQRVLELARERDASVRCLRDVWPDFTLFVHGGVKYGPFDPRVREVWSGAGGADVPARLEVYPASEGFIAVQDTRGDPGLRLHTDMGVFYEFVPLEEIDAAEPRAFLCDEVERGQRYVVTMTTCAGLWRYVIGDVVEFDTIPPEGPARLRIVGRHRHFVNAFGENLIVEDIEHGVVEAMKAVAGAGVRVGEFTAAPVYPGEGRRPGLELAVEWEGPEGPAVEAFAAAFDAAIQAKNVDYLTKRTGGVGMAPARVSAVPMGAFHRWMQSRGRLGGQNKCPRCANHREYLDGVLATAAAV
ncbi:MAG: GH3 auxin-responsive promoter family protein [Phycisphaerales bacterium]|nr:GH3 auxin-responsive promoter family protein [Phycisphaerales bacterium]